MLLHRLSAVFASMNEQKATVSAQRAKLHCQILPQYANKCSTCAHAFGKRTYKHLCKPTGATCSNLMTSHSQISCHACRLFVRFPESDTKFATSRSTPIQALNNGCFAISAEDNCKTHKPSAFYWSIGCQSQGKKGGLGNSDNHAVAQMYLCAVCKTMHIDNPRCILIPKSRCNPVLDSHHDRRSVRSKPNKFPC